MPCSASEVSAYTFDNLLPLFAEKFSTKQISTIYRASGSDFYLLCVIGILPVEKRLLYNTQVLILVKIVPLLYPRYFSMN